MREEGTLLEPSREVATSLEAAQAISLQLPWFVADGQADSVASGDLKMRQIFQTIQEEEFHLASPVSLPVSSC